MSARTPPSPASLPRVPLTALRRLYDLLRITSSEFHLATATELNRKPSVLWTMVEKCYRHFSAYENLKADFHNRGSTGSLTRDCSVGTNEPRRLVTALRNDHVNGTDDFAFDYVDYEVCPNLTIDRAMSEEGQRAKRGSPVDLLLRCRTTRVPIICEVKMASRGERDQNTFFALIQGLMYAVELLTENQRSRLKHVYGEKLCYRTEGPYADLYLMLIGHHATDPGRGADLYQEADTLAGKLMASDNSVSSLLRRIVCLNATLEDRDGKDFFRLEKLFAHGRLS